MLRALVIGACVAVVWAAQAQAGVDAGFNGAPGSLPSRVEASPADAGAAVLAAASAVAGRPVTLECESAEALRAQVGWALAYVVLDGSSAIHAGPTVCGWLAHPETPYTFGQGLLAVIHEARHLATNSVDESLVNCSALALMPDVVRQHFGAMNATAVLAGAARFFSMTPDSYRRCG